MGFQAQFAWHLAKIGEEQIKSDEGHIRYARNCRSAGSDQGAHAGSC
jgi:hypothetical protein